MKFLDRFGLWLFSILILALSIILVLIGAGWMDATIFGILITQALSSQTGTYIFVGVCAFLALLAIKCLFFNSYSSVKEKEREKSEKGIILENEDGRLLITRDTLENIVEVVAKEFDDIQAVYPRVIINKDNTVYMNITLDIYEGIVIKDLTSKFQSKIKEKIKEDTDLELSAVNIKVNNVEAPEPVESKKSKKRSLASDGEEE